MLPPPHAVTLARRYIWRGEYQRAVARWIRYHVFTTRANDSRPGWATASVRIPSDRSKLRRPTCRHFLESYVRVLSSVGRSSPDAEISGSLYGVELHQVYRYIRLYSTDRSLIKCYVSVSHLGACMHPLIDQLVPIGRSTRVSIALERGRECC